VGVAYSIIISKPIPSMIFGENFRHTGTAVTYLVIMTVIMTVMAGISVIF
jgi:hypothetical protein